MRPIGLRTFNAIAIMIIAFFLTILMTISFTSCEKADVATTTATLRTKEITLNPTAGNLQSGKAIIAENADHSFNVSITLQNTVKDTVMVMHVHNGSIASPGTIAIPLSNITGTGGQATGTTLNIKTATSAAGPSVAVTYDKIITYLGYFIVHYSAGQIGNVVANGNIQ